MNGDITTWIPILSSLIAVIGLIIVTIIQVNSKKKQAERDERDKELKVELESIGDKLSDINTQLEENRLEDIQHKTDYNAHKETTSRQISELKKRDYEQDKTIKKNSEDIAEIKGKLNKH